MKRRLPACPPPTQAGETLLMFAIALGRSGFAKFLVEECGADVNARCGLVRASCVGRESSRGLASPLPMGGVQHVVACPGRRSHPRLLRPRACRPALPPHLYGLIAMPPRDARCPVCPTPTCRVLQTGMTPFLLACKHNQPELARWLVETRDVDINTSDKVRVCGRACGSGGPAERIRGVLRMFRLGDRRVLGPRVACRMPFPRLFVYMRGVRVRVCVCRPACTKSKFVCVDGICVCDMM